MTPDREVREPTLILGRDPEQAALSAFVAEEPDAPAAVVLRGEAGMGKTTLWQSAVRQARERGDHVLVAQPTEFERHLSFAALADLLRDVTPEVMAAIPEPQRSGLDAALRRVDRPTDPLAIGMGFVSVLSVLAAPGSGSSRVLVAVDDIHWIDGPTARVLEFALRRATERGAGLLFAARSNEPAPVLDALSRAVPGDRIQFLDLGPLSLGALHRLLSARLGRQFARPILTRLQEASGGNPFVALEIAVALIESDEPVVAGLPLPVPASLRQLLGRRIARLPAATRAALLVISALGEAGEEKVATVLGVDDLEAVLAPAEAAGILASERPEIRFSHPMMAAVVYATASPRRLRDLHARLAALSSEVEGRARHLARSAEAPDATIATALEEAGRHARQRGAPDAGAELLAQAWTYTPTTDRAGMTRRLLAAGEVMLEAADTEAGRRLLEDAIALMPRGQDRARALLLLATIRWYDDAGAAHRLADEALQDAVGYPTLQGRIHSRMALFSGDADEAMAHHDQAVHLIDPDEDPSLLAFALFSRFYGGIEAGEPPALDLFERALDLEPERPGWEASTIPALWWKYTDQYPLARDRLHLHLRWARETGDASSDADLFAHLAELELWSGDWRRAEQYAEQSVDAAEQMGQPLSNSSHRIQALVWAHLGRTAQARAAARAGKEATPPDDRMLSAMYRTVLGFAAISDADPAAAHGELAALEAELGQIHQVEPIRFRWEPDHLEALLALGEVVAAEAVLANLVRRHESLPRPWTAVVTPRSNALIIAARGDSERALEESGAAVAALTALHSPFEHGRTLLIHGQLLRRANQRRAAARALADAQAIFERLPAPLWAVRARVEAARLGRRRGAGTSLTPGEREVALLAAGGMTNQQVAATLFISPKTVEANLGRVYAKLGIHSRAELGRVMAAGAPGESGAPATNS